ncbi:protein HAPLESS 2 [Prunus yedoensis var. nudiflora]|uniref:Protein HAPLESS 2 n=1 Tax=Prunus yedoensis var. nudiflora TaxID=2094558 RepID=A0A314ZW09_PRUYE|nr:protein HAPLESS 2 [Prunus yedoensis var. nudiflora]
MGDVISKAADGVGGLLEKAFLAPFKTMFGGSCEDVCSGPWDFGCFIEHLCVSSLLKLLMILVLCYITLLFFYLLFKLGLFQCIGKSLCKMCWAACETYWYALEDITCFLWYKLKNTKRVNRHRHRHRRRSQFRDIEQGYSSSEENDLWDNYHELNVSRKRKSLSRRRKDKLQSSVYPSSRSGTRSHHHVGLKSRGRSVRIGGRSQRPRSSRHLRLRKVRNVRRQARTSKRRKLR